MKLIVYDFKINSRGTFAELQTVGSAMMPARYYTLQVPRLIAEGTAPLNPLRKSDVDHFANACPDTGALLRVLRTMLNKHFPVTRSAADSATAAWDEAAERIRQENGFDPIQHAQLREDLQPGRIGPARNRLSVDTEIRDVEGADLISLPDLPRAFVAVSHPRGQ